MVSAVASAKPTARRSMCVRFAAAARRQQQDAGGERGDADPGADMQVLADEDEARRRRHQRRRAARDRIDVAEIAGAVALDQRGEIAEMDDRRGDQPRPGGGIRHTDERQHDEPTTAEPIAISVVVVSGSSPILISAFQPAWHSAANKTARKTRLVT